MFDVLFSCVSVFPHFLSNSSPDLNRSVSSSHRNIAENEGCSIAVLTVCKQLVHSGSFFVALSVLVRR